MQGIIKLDENHQLDYRRTRAGAFHYEVQYIPRGWTPMRVAVGGVTGLHKNSQITALAVIGHEALRGACCRPPIGVIGGEPKTGKGRFGEDASNRSEIKRRSNRTKTDSPPASTRTWSRRKADRS